MNLYQTKVKCDWLRLIGCGLLLVVLPQIGHSQKKVDFGQLDFFDSPGKTWSLVSDVFADLENQEQLKASKGVGILLNQPTKRNQGKDLLSKEHYGDMDLELEYMTFRGSNSGIYLQGRYEVQILDSWTKLNPGSGDNGGIYERWDENRPEGQKGYQGYAPRYNVSKAPGLWQKVKISFQAPRFDDSGNKISNAKMLSVELNGVTIHENVELLGPTRSAYSQEETARGPLMIQGDHGPVAIRNLVITPFDNPTPSLSELTYKLYEGAFEQKPDLGSLEADLSGELTALGSDFKTEANQYLAVYHGNLSVPETGKYKMRVQTPGGEGHLVIGGKEVLDYNASNRNIEVELEKGEHEVELGFSKRTTWMPAALGWSISGPGVREKQLSQSASEGASGVGAILVNQQERPVLRSFMDVPGHGRLTHAVSVGSPQNVHYTYDLLSGNLVQVWRGGFLDATPMWNSRGDGSSRPSGAVSRLGKPSFALAKLSQDQDAWPSDSTGTAFRSHGYRTMGQEYQLVYQYELHGAHVADELEVLAEGKGLSRKITVSDAPEGFSLRLAAGAQIQDLGDGLYAVDDKTYYIQLHQGNAGIIDAGEGQELRMPITGEASYSLLF
ncbi:3-keto-disaccharide hydrolase [Pleomorphovibrio marinus]|uniref:3-keto-disaccharide hydrolase n=1 Tax=Pleomorphovibrio marinus TaxID=2164132 RepID=UPI0018E4EBCD|nr:DUF1080 domain-containing protein [Pleomorphovibrio marinus]